jgi:hypothetical protein
MRWRRGSKKTAWWLFFCTHMNLPARGFTKRYSVRGERFYVFGFLSQRHITEPLLFADLGGKFMRVLPFSNTSLGWSA